MQCVRICLSGSGVIKRMLFLCVTRRISFIFLASSTMILINLVNLDKVSSPGGVCHECVLFDVHYI